MLVTAERIRSMIADCRTEPDVIRVLRSHKVKYSFATDTGYLSIRIPCKKGYIRIYKTCSRSAPMRITTGNPVPYSMPRFRPYE